MTAMNTPSRRLKRWCLVQGGCLALVALGGCNAITGVGDFDAVSTSLVDTDGSATGSAPPGSDSTTNTPPGDDTPGTDEEVDSGGSSVLPGQDDAGSTDDSGAFGDSGTSGDAGGQVGDRDSGPVIVDKRVFVTSTSKTGSMGGLAGADTWCQSSATNAGLTGTWIAWLSTNSKEAIDRITYDGRYVRLDGLEVVASKDQLATAPLTNPITITEYGTVFDSTLGHKDIWTGTSAAKGDNSGSSCNNWTSEGVLAMGTRGNAAATSRPEWTQVPGFANGGWGCQVALSIYCFER